MFDVSALAVDVGGDAVLRLAVFDAERPKGPRNNVGKRTGEDQRRRQRGRGVGSQTGDDIRRKRVGHIQTSSENLLRTFSLVAGWLQLAQVEPTILVS